MIFRRGFGGNWPMVNVVGPKVWAVPMATASESVYRYAGDDVFGFGIDAGRGGILLMLACLWLVTVRQVRDPDDLATPIRAEGWFSPRRLARWTSIGLVAGALGLFVGGIDPAVLDLPTYARLSAHTLPLTMFVEAPATLAVFLYLASLARSEGDERLSRSLAWAGLFACTLILAGNGLFLASHLGIRRGGLSASAVIAAYGLAAVSVGLWMTWRVLGLVRLLLARTFAPSQRQLTLFAEVTVAASGRVPLPPEIVWQAAARRAAGPTSAVSPTGGTPCRGLPEVAEHDLARNELTSGKNAERKLIKAANRRRTRLAICYDAKPTG